MYIYIYTLSLMRLSIPQESPASAETVNVRPGTLKPRPRAENSKT